RFVLGVKASRHSGGRRVPTLVRHKQNLFRHRKGFCPGRVVHFIPSTVPLRVPHPLRSKGWVFASCKMCARATWLETVLWPATSPFHHLQLLPSPAATYAPKTRPVCRGFGRNPAQVQLRCTRLRCHARARPFADL